MLSAIPSSQVLNAERPSNCRALRATVTKTSCVTSSAQARHEPSCRRTKRDTPRRCCSTRLDNAPASPATYSASKRSSLFLKIEIRRCLRDLDAPACHLNGRRDYLELKVVEPHLAVPAQQNAECDVSGVVRHVEHDFDPRPVDGALDRAPLHVVERENLRLVSLGWSIDAHPDARPS